MVIAFLGWLGFACLLSIFLFVDAACAAFPWRFGQGVNELSASLTDPHTQWLVLLCFVFQFVSLLVIQRRLTFGPGRPGRLADIWIVAFIVFVLASYILKHDAVSNSSQVLVLFGCIVFSKVVSFSVEKTWTSADAAKGHATRLTGIIIVIVLLSASTLLQRWNMSFYQYHGVRRWNGAWENPNIYGMFMGCSVVLSFGFLGAGFLRKNLQLSTFWLRIFLSLAIITCGIGLFKSYSRGAWLATFCGLAYLGWRAVKRMKFRRERQLRGSRSRSQEVPISPLTRFSRVVLRDWKMLLIVGASLAVIAFWQFRYTEWRPVRRVFSVANTDDFSWQNRVRAWQGAFQMMAHRLLFGYGWGEAEMVYQKEYLGPMVEDGSAIKTNDYLMLGLSAGTPALVCFLTYVVLSLRSSSSSVFRIPVFDGPQRTVVAEEEDLLRAICRAGAIVLLVGFWFDGGMFKLATGAVFWTLIELGRLDLMDQEKLNPLAMVRLFHGDKMSPSTAERDTRG